ncbi:MAG: ISKra4 family transposase, partial [Acidimicrobiales bacterium]
PAPRAKAKWVTASVADDAAEVIGRVFDEAERRDPEHKRRWVALVDGNCHQIERIEAEAEQRKVDVAVVVDLIHVLEYLWGAVWCFFAEGEAAGEGWVRDRALAVLEGKALDVAAGIRRRATKAGLPKAKRKKADDCARYLVNKAAYLDYPAALAAGWPIATGVIEGTCRYLVADRMDITGARWSVKGAEAVLKLRAMRRNGDFDAYWRWHLDRERRRVHEARYANGVVPLAA